MKKFGIITLTLALSAALLVGCGCMNTNADVTTLPTNGETVTPSRPTTAPTTMPTTAATTESTPESTNESTADTSTGTGESTGALEGAMDDILGGSTDDATAATDTTGAGRSRGHGMPNS